MTSATVDAVLPLAYPSARESVRDNKTGCPRCARRSGVFGDGD